MSITQPAKLRNKLYLKQNSQNQTNPNSIIQRILHGEGEISAFIDPVVAETMRINQDRCDAEFNSAPSSQIPKTKTVKRPRTVKQLRLLAEKANTNMMNAIGVDVTNYRPKPKRSKPNKGFEAHPNTIATNKIVKIQEIHGNFESSQTGDVMPAFIDGKKTSNLRIVQKNLDSKVKADLLAIKIMLSQASIEELPHLKRLIQTSFALSQSIEGILQELRKLKEERELDASIRRQRLNII